MLKNYAKELTMVGIVFGLISYAIYVLAAEPAKTNPVVVTAKKAEPVKKESAKPAAKKEATKPTEPAKKEHKKKPTLKKKYADKK
jgi:hypothetical protein